MKPGSDCKCCCKQEDGGGYHMETCDGDGGSFKQADKGCGACMGERSCYRASDSKIGDKSCVHHFSCEYLENSFIKEYSCRSSNACARMNWSQKLERIVVESVATTLTLATTPGTPTLGIIHVKNIIVAMH